MRSTPSRAPPAASRASTTREPVSSTAMPGRRTLPATSTVTDPPPGPAEPDGVGLPDMDTRSAAGRGGGAATSAGPPPSSHQARQPESGEDHDRDHHQLEGTQRQPPACGVAARRGDRGPDRGNADGERLSQRPDPRVRGVVARGRLTPGRGELGPQQLEPACDGLLVSTASPRSPSHAATLGSRDGRRHRPQRACGQPPGTIASERAAPSATEERGERSEPATREDGAPQRARTRPEAQRRGK